MVDAAAATREAAETVAIQQLQQQQSTSVAVSGLLLSTRTTTTSTSTSTSNTATTATSNSEQQQQRQQQQPGQKESKGSHGGTRDHGDLTMEHIQRVRTTYFCVECGLVCLSPTATAATISEQDRRWDDDCDP